MIVRVSFVSIFKLLGLHLEPNLKSSSYADNVCVQDFLDYIL